MPPRSPAVFLSWPPPGFPPRFPGVFSGRPPRVLALPLEVPAEFPSLGLPAAPGPDVRLDVPAPLGLLGWLGALTCPAGTLDAVFCCPQADTEIAIDDRSKIDCRAALRQRVCTFITASRTPSRFHSGNCCATSATQKNEGSWLPQEG